MVGSQWVDVVWPLVPGLQATVDVVGRHIERQGARCNNQLLSACRGQGSRYFPSEHQQQGRASSQQQSHDRRRLDLRALIQFLVWIHSILLVLLLLSSPSSSIESYLCLLVLVPSAVCLIVVMLNI